MKLYQNPHSPPCRRVLAVVHQLGLKPELQSVEFGSPMLQTPEYLAKNPNGAIPLLEDGDYALWESHAIMQYLAEKNGSDLYPKGFKARLEVTRWCSWQAYHMGQAAGTYVWENLVKPMMKLGETDAKALAEAAEDFHKYAGVLDQQLARNQFVTGKALTIADFSLASTFMYAEPAKMPWEQYTHVRAWYKRIEATEGWKKSAPPNLS